MTNHELVLPAADPERAKYAFLFGADACYGGPARYSLRKAEVDFDVQSLGETIDLAHSLGKKFYVTINIFPKDTQMAGLAETVSTIANSKPDAFIASDPGAINVIKRQAPGIPIHLSTQANTTNSESVRFWADQGIKRIVLARELTLSEISTIHKAAPEVELECFVHGAMCIAYSGRCLLSAALTGREANQGMCAHTCRWQYNLVEQTRPGEYFPIEEDETGTYIMNSKDLCLLPHLDQLAEAGVTSFKVEGRNKTEYYVSVMARAYKEAVSLIGKNDKESAERIAELMDEIRTTNHRGLTTGFLFGDAHKGETFDRAVPIRGYQYVGVAANDTTSRPEGLADYHEIKVKNKMVVGDTLEMITPLATSSFELEKMYNLRGHPVSDASPGNTMSRVFMQLPEPRTAGTSGPILLRKKAD